VVVHYLIDIKVDKEYTVVLCVERLIQPIRLLLIVIKLYVDGGTRGMVICLHDPQRDKYIIKRRKGDLTNNDLEYLAIIYGIEYAKKYYPRDLITILSDSRLAVKQIKGEYKVTTDNLKALHKKVERKMIPGIKIKWISRDFNLAGIHLERLRGMLRSSHF
jgi:hypothetical protein